MVDLVANLASAQFLEICFFEVWLVGFIMFHQTPGSTQAALPGRFLSCRALFFERKHDMCNSGGEIGLEPRGISDEVLGVVEIATEHWLGWSLIS